MLQRDELCICAYGANTAPLRCASSALTVTFASCAELVLLLHPIAPARWQYAPAAIITSTHCISTFIRLVLQGVVKRLLCKWL